MRAIVLSKAEYRDKVFACWLGKNIGGTLGAPYEGRKYVNDLDFYHPVPKEAAANDDLDLQLVWLKMLEDKGVRPRLPDFAEYWVRYLSAYPWNEYGFCRRNLGRGLMPPISGCFENYFVDEMGAPIRSEIWACIAPGDPQLAAAMAWNDAAMDHAGGEGMYGEMFWAAVESAAFVIDDPMTLIRIGLGMIPIPCHISRVIREAMWCWQNGLRWAEARERIATRFGHLQPCNAIPNHGFMILGWLYGKDYGDRLCKAVNCGYDTDCTGATLGSVLGICGGTKAIPKKWVEPIGEAIVLHKFTGKFNAPKTIGELTKRTVALGERCLADRSDTVALGQRSKTPPEVSSLLFRNEGATAALSQDVHAAVMADGDLEVILHYGGEPVLWPGIARTWSVSLRSGETSVEGTAKVQAPRGWQVSPVKKEGARHRFEVQAQKVPARNTIVVSGRASGRSYKASFTVLGPEEAKGYRAGDNVPVCPRCWAWEGACICEDRQRGQG